MDPAIPDVSDWEPKTVTDYFTKQGFVDEHAAVFLKEVSRYVHGCQMAKFDPFLSLDCARMEGVRAQSKETKGSNFAAQGSGAIVQKPEGPNTYDLKILL